MFGTTGAPTKQAIINRIRQIHSAAGRLLLQTSKPVFVNLPVDRKKKKE
jgi:hypothetical protein